MNTFRENISHRSVEMEVRSRFSKKRKTAVSASNDDIRKKIGL
jgi:hypothetical protein